MVFQLHRRYNPFRPDAADFRAIPYRQVADENRIISSVSEFNFQRAGILSGFTVSATNLIYKFILYRFESKVNRPFFFSAAAFHKFWKINPVRNRSVIVFIWALVTIVCPETHITNAKNFSFTAHFLHFLQLQRYI